MLVLYWYRRLFCFVCIRFKGTAKLSVCRTYLSTYTTQAQLLNIIMTGFPHRAAFDVRGKIGWLARFPGGVSRLDRSPSGGGPVVDCAPYIFSV